MIPKTIHYCWFGGNPKSDIMENCIASWREFCPDYEIIEWNESNFDVHFCDYASDAYKNKQWGYLSDIARIKIIHDHGGNYLDVDVLLHNSLDDFLEYDAWFAQDDVRYINTGLGFGAQKGHLLTGKLLDIRQSMDYVAQICNFIDTPIIEKYLPNWIRAEHNQVTDGVLIVGYKDYPFYAKHLYTGSWGDKNTQHQRDARIKSNNTFSPGQMILWKLKCFLRQPKFNNYFLKRKGTFCEKVYTFVVYDLLDCGIIYFLKLILLKLKKVLTHAS